MKKIINICLLIILSLASASAKTFDESDSRTKDYITINLAKAIRDYDIAIVHGRRDETYRRLDSPLNIYYEMPLELRRLRLIAMLKGLVEVEYNDVVYIYVPDKNAIGKPFVWREVGPSVSIEEVLPSPYIPSISHDDLMRLVFMKRQATPLKDRVLEGYRSQERMKQFVEDALAMDGKELMDKYNLNDIFPNRVYLLAEACIFQVDYPAPEMPETKSMQMNRKNWELTKAHTPEVQKYSHLIHLSKREVSEIVFIAYIFDENDGINKYAKVCKTNTQILLPITEPVFETEIGRMLYEALNKDMNANVSNSGINLTNSSIDAVNDLNTNQ